MTRQQRCSQRGEMRRQSKGAPSELVQQLLLLGLMTGLVLPGALHPKLVLLNTQVT